MVSHRSLLIAVLLASPALADDESLMACSEITKDTDRLQCFDKLVADLKDSLNTPQKGTQSERIEAGLSTFKPLSSGSRKSKKGKNAPEAVGIKM